ncbi:MAG: amino acid adenylation domain-containing protein, partial [Tumebacillaceae bacterium]
RHQMLVDWNDTQAPVSDELLHTLFVKQVRVHPKQLAVQAANGSLTYGELYERASQMAQMLRQAGVRPNQLVAVVMEKGWEPIVAVLGVLMAGGAYLPVDPALPQERLWFLLEHSEVRHVLTQSWLESRLEWPDDVQRHCVDGDAWDTYEPVMPEVVQGAEDLAYVIFTSGSTGVPKGVMIDHRGAVNTILDINRRFQVGPQDLVLAMASLSFDLSVYDIFGTLAAGGTIVVPSAERLQDPSHWREVIAETRVSIWNSAPALAGLLVDGLTAEEARELSSLRLVMMSGDWIPLHVPEWFHRELPQVEVVSLGGATEASIWSILYPIEEVDPRWKSIPYGRPMDNQSFYVLNDELELCPVGVVGHLFIGGIGLAKGYWKDDVKTATSFIVHPSLGERLYRTGDQGRFGADGTIEFLGRSDNQVKIRGFRIELGEIEATLREHPGIHDVVVIARGEGRLEKKLVAYVVPHAAQSVAHGELRQFVKERLPEYMIPSAFVDMHELPITPNGKVDRRALPEPMVQMATSEQGYAAPSTPLEAALADIWAAALRMEQVGVHDNFFALGGDSILSIQIVQRAQRAGIRLAPKDLFQHQTVAQLAQVAKSVEFSQENCEQGPVSGTVELTPIQRWFGELELQDPHHWNLPIVLEMAEQVDRAALQMAIEQLVRHHDLLRLRYGVDERGSHAFLHEEAEVSLITVDLSELSFAEQETAWAVEGEKWQASLHLEDGPLVRFVWFDFGPERPSRLLLAFHHLVVDGVSWRILLEDLHTAYEQSKVGNAVQLPPKTTSFQKWAERLVAYAQSDTAQQERAYWLEVGASGVASLPVDYDQTLELADGANMEASSQKVSVTLSKADTQRLLHEASKAYNTQMNDLLLTALVEAFDEWSGHDSLLLHVEGHGREEVIEDVDLSRTVGWFTTLYPLHLQLEGVQQPGNRIKSVKEQLRSVPNRGFGYGVLRYLSADAETKRLLQEMPQPEVIFNYLGQLDATFA